MSYDGLEGNPGLELLSGVTGLCKRGSNSFAVQVYDTLHVIPLYICMCVCAGEVEWSLVNGKTRTLEPFIGIDFGRGKWKIGSFLLTR